MNRRASRLRLRPRPDPLEPRLCLANSVGWDGAGRGGAVLTYFIGDAPASLGQAAVDAAFRTALDAWSAVADVRFKPTAQPNLSRSLDLTFRPIDGEGGTLARGFLPADVNPARVAGDVQFDSTERWEVGNDRGRASVDLVLVAVHEIGHALGLEHSDRAGSVMAPSLSPGQSFSGLAATDVGAIRALYATARKATAPATSVTAASDRVAEAPAPKPPSRPHPRPRLPRAWRGGPIVA